MATLCAALDGLITSAPAWRGVLHEMDSEVATSALTNGTYDTQQFSGNIDVDAIYLKVSSRNATAGTVQAILRNVTDGVDVVSTTVNMSDIPNGPGWVCFSFATTVTSIAKLYCVRVVLAGVTGGSLSLYRDGTANNFSRIVRSATNGPLAAGSKLIVSGERTGPGLLTTRSLTMNLNTATAMGAIYVSDGATITRSVSANTLLTISGITVDAVKHGIRIYAGGTWNDGTSGSPVPSTFTAQTVFSVGVNVEFGFDVLSGGVWNAYGASDFRTLFRTLLNADAAAAATSLTTLADTGWKTGDEIGIAPTGSAASSASELRTLSGDAVGTAVPVPALSQAHSGSVSGIYDTRAELVLFTRNVRILGVSASLQGYVNIATGATANCRYVEFKWLGSATTNKRGVDVAALSDFRGCSFHQFGVNTANTITIVNCIGIQTSGANNINVQECNFGWTSGPMLTPATAAGVMTFIDVWGIFCLSNGINASEVDGTFTGCRMAGCAAVGFAMGASTYLGTFQNNITHSNNSAGFQFNSVIGGTLSGCVAWRNGSYDFDFSGCRGYWTCDTITAYGAVTGNIRAIAFSGILNVLNSSLQRGLTNQSSSCIRLDTATLVLLDNCDLGSVTPHLTLFSIGGDFAQARARNCLVSATTEVNDTNARQASFVEFERHNRTDVHKRYTRSGWVERVTTGVPSGMTAPVMKSTPAQTFTAAADKLEVKPALLIPVTGGVAHTITLSAYKSSTALDGADYNGNQPRLIAKRQDALGVTADTVLDTMAVANGAVEVLSGSITPARDGILEVTLDCDGTTGFVLADGLTASGGSTDHTGLEFWLNGMPFDMVAL